MRKSSGSVEVALAGYPFLFAMQQTMEGALWLTLPDPANHAVTGALANAFAFVALGIWPLFVPLTTALLEPSPLRRSTFLWIAGVGFIYALYTFADVAAHPYAAEVLGRTLSYANGRPFPTAAAIAYGTCTCAPLLLSSARTLKVLGFCVLSGLLVSLAFYYFTLLSVWCFFAALASGVVFFRAYVELPRRRAGVVTGG